VGKGHAFHKLHVCSGAWSYSRAAGDPFGTGVRVQVHSIGDWWQADPDCSLMKVAERAIEAEWGVRPLLVREGEPAAQRMQRSACRPLLRCLVGGGRRARVSPSPLGLRPHSEPTCSAGGTMPVASALEKMLGAPAILLPMGQSSDNCHLANERIHRDNLVRGKNVVKGLLTEVGRLAAQGQLDP
jgi:di- and tripeptidase/Cys-Gly metallodipeptidase DUG1